MTQYPSTFMAELFSRLQSRGLTSSWHVDQLVYALSNIASNPSTFLPQVVPQALDIHPDALDQVPVDILIHEMLRRGFAVMKVPESGMPEALVSK